MSKVTAKYKIAMPVEIRNELGIVPGTEVNITKDEDKYILIVNPIKEIKKEEAWKI